MNPFPSLALLSTHIDHEHLMILQCKRRLCNPDRPRSALDDILIMGLVRWVKQPIQ